MSQRLFSAPGTNLKFDGNNDYVNCPGLSLANTSFSIEFWAQRQGGIGNYQYIMSQGTATTDQFVGILFRVTTNVLSFSFWGDDLDAVTAISDLNWHHYACTYDATTKLQSIYIDGVLDASRTATANTSSTGTCYIGGNGGSSQTFNGNLDEFRVYNYALTATEISSRKNCELNGNETGLIRYYQFNEGTAGGSNGNIFSALPLPDVTAGGNNGSLKGFASTGTSSNWMGGSPVTSGITVPAPPTVITPVYIAKGATASALTATGTSLTWFTTATGGTGSSTAPTPTTSTAGTTSYWVTSGNAAGCQSTRVEIDAIIKSTASYLNFDGVNDAITLAATGFPTGNSARTIEAWIRTTQNNGGGTIMTYGDLSLSNRFALYQTGGKLNFVAENNDYNTNVVINDGVWHHVAATYDGTTVKVYIDGTLAGSSAKSLNTTGTAFNIGYRGTASEYFKGDIDEVRVWNTARSAANLSSNCPLVGNETGLLAYYRFDQGSPGGTNTSVTSLLDATANNKNGTLSGFALTGNASNWLIMAPLSTGPDVISPVTYCQTTTAAALTAPGSGLLWYTTRFGGTGSSTAPTPSTSGTGTTSYWVTQPITCGESPRSRIDVVVNPQILATANTTISLNISSTTYFKNACKDVIAIVSPTGASPISGNTTAKVWLEGTQPAQYVKRHYEITPASNASTATGTITLYFTQAEFNAFNAVNSIKLPTGPTDNTGISNLLVEKRGGVSSDGTGIHSTYSGTITTIKPVNSNIVWNATASRWEITFDVTSFSGFFVKTISSTLPITLVNFTAQKRNNEVLISWKEENALNFSHYEVERSKDGLVYTKIGTVAAKNISSTNNYQFTDAEAWDTDVRYYRLKMVDNDGTSRYSTVVRVSNKATGSITVYPSPADDYITVDLNNNSNTNTTALLLDVTGKVIKPVTITGQHTTVGLSGLYSGTYLLRFDNGQTIKFIKK
ncbi:T9SS type A sorting domain-containing protein [Niastella sp. MAH-29]|uniref:T9SS type A sorting domain-containing protein n=2 Tax=Chitinophagaceae TaxID=563835 RepID=A0ABS3Z0V7_9BACT|nr:T9SS type A sorting domain-containing protein [Niastella soli]